MMKFNLLILSFLTVFSSFSHGAFEVDPALYGIEEGREYRNRAEVEAYLIHGFALIDQTLNNMNAAYSEILASVERRDSVEDFMGKVEGLKSFRKKYRTLEAQFKREKSAIKIHWVGRNFDEADSVDDALMRSFYFKYDNRLEELETMVRGITIDFVSFDGDMLRNIEINYRGRKTLCGSRENCPEFETFKESLSSKYMALKIDINDALVAARALIESKIEIKSKS